jgi:D-arabinose 1-dehydrogenase-like Zn-dependent alcohol dehydrogenase
MERRKIWLITGVSNGLGLATVKYLVSKKQAVIAIVSDTENLNQDLLTNPLLDVILLDTTNETQLAQVTDYLGSTYGQIDLLVNPVGETLSLTRSLLPLIRKDGKGHLIDFSSRLLHRSGSSSHQPTSFDKSLSQLLCREAIAFGIKVTIIKQEHAFVPFSIN